LRTKREEAYLVVVASLLGDLIAWATQQAGRTIHDVFPVEQHRDMQIGTGSRELLTWHTEDAFHPLRGDYLAMFCLRNPQSVPTMIASIADVELDAETKRQLFQPRFTILPDESHRGTTGVADFAPESAAGIEEMLRAPQEIAVLFGDSARPYVRLDPYFMPPPEDAQAREALRRLIFELDNHIKDVVLGPGDLCVMDNYQVVHGRRPFEPRFDGTDRWLKRVLVARDLRKSIEARRSIHSRVIR
jgi:Fe(II)/alpha-ketoglutarate-dependent arginine beta-hydroxylase